MSLAPWLAVQAVLFGAAGVGLIAVGSVVLGLVFGVLVVANLAPVLFWRKGGTVT